MARKPAQSLGLKAASLAIRVTGLGGVLINLANINSKVGKKAARRALRTCGKVVAEKARQLVPVDTGKLKKSIKVRSYKASKKARGKIGIRVVSGADGKGPAFYGRFVELGTKRMPSQPFMRPAIYANRRRLRAIFAAEVIKELHAAKTKGKTK